MKPFVSDHPLFHPAPALIELLAKQGLDDLAHRISGFSLKYLRSGSSVYIILPDSGDYGATVARLEVAFASVGRERLRRTRTSTKIILPAGMAGENETHIIVQDTSHPPDIFISTDSLFYNPGEHCWAGGEQATFDYERGILRLVEPDRPDAAGALQLCSLSAMLDFFPCDETIDAIRHGGTTEGLQTLPRSFLRSQLQKIVTGAKPSQGFLALEKSGLLDWFMPELARGRDLMQNRHHRFDILHHCIFSCDAAERNELHLRLAGLLHDIGKVPTRHVTASGEATFHNHEVIGAKIAGQVLFRFGFSRDVCEKVKFLVRNHMFHYTNEWTDRAVRRFLSRVSISDLKDLIDLRMADRRGSGKTTALPPQVRKMLYHIEKIQKDEAELKVRNLTVGGEDLMALGMQPGPEFGSILKNILDRVRRGELINERTVLLPVLAEAVAAQSSGEKCTARTPEESIPVQEEALVTERPQP